MPELTPDRLHKLWSRVDIQGFDDCWNWTAGVNSQNRPTMTLSEGTFQVARLVYFHQHGVDPDKHCVLHTCDNPLCLNPNHLWLGSRKDNNADRDRKGRFVASRGGQKISDKDREYIFNSNLPTKDLAEHFGLSRGRVCVIRRARLGTKNSRPNKLTPEDREVIANSLEPVIVLAERYGVTPRVIHLLRPANVQYVRYKPGKRHA